MTRAITLCIVSTLCSSVNATTYTPIAREFTNGLFNLDPTVPAALSEDGKVAFMGTATGGGAQLFAWNSGSLTNQLLAPNGYSQITGLQINSSNNIVFAGRRDAGSDDFTGVYRTTLALGATTTIREDDVTTGPSTRYVALADNNTLAYSNLVSGNGAIYRHDINAAPSVLRSGSGTFFNNQQLDVNGAGQVAVQMEHLRPFGGLGRGILVFETPAQTIAATKTAFEQVGVGVQPKLSINSSGQIAFSLSSTSTLNFYNPVNDFNGTLIDTVTLQPGVYVVDPALYGTPRAYTKIVDNTGPFSSFDRVQINDAGLVLFEAGLDAGGFGIYAGDDPVADKLVQTGELLGATFVSVLELGELNNVGQFTFITSDFITTDRQVWLAQVPEPGSIGGIALLASIVRRRR